MTSLWHCKTEGLAELGFSVSAKSFHDWKSMAACSPTEYLGLRRTQAARKSNIKYLIMQKIKIKRAWLFMDTCSQTQKVDKTHTHTHKPQIKPTLKDRVRKKKKYKLKSMQLHCVLNYRLLLPLVSFKKWNIKTLV